MFPQICLSDAAIVVPVSTKEGIIPFTFHNRLYVYGGIDIKEGQRGTMYSINLDSSPQEWAPIELHGTFPRKKRE